MVQKTLFFSITPSIALLLALSYSGVIAFQSHLFFPMLLPVLFMAVMAREHWLLLLKRLFWLNTLIVLIALTLLLQGNEALALLIFIRSNLILAFILLLFYDKDEFAISLGMQQLKISPKLTALFFFTAKSIFLIKREFELLKYMMQNKNLVITREMILAKVWGYEYMGDTNVVDVYIRYLRSKIDDQFGIKLIHTIRGVGYQIKDE